MASRFVSACPPRRASRLAQLAAVGAVSVVALTACKASVHIGSSPQVSKSDLEAKVAGQLAAQLNQPTPTITCPGPLDAKVGASIDCILVAQGETAKFSVHVVMDSFNSSTGDYNLSFKVGDTPITRG